MCVIIPSGSVYLGADGEIHVAKCAKPKVKEAEVQNKIMMQCATLGCPMQGELRTAQFGKPEGWYSVVVEGPTEKDRISAVLCPACAEATLGGLVPKRPQATPVQP